MSEATDTQGTEDKAGSLQPVVQWFAAPYVEWDEGWWGPHPTKQHAVRDMLAMYDGRDLTECIVSPGHFVTPETDPDLYDGDDCLSEWEYQVEGPYEVYPLNVQGQRAGDTASQTKE